MGEIVIARCHRGVAAKLRYVEREGHMIYLLGERRFFAFQRGEPNIMPIGFPIEDVFKDSDSVKAGDSPVWGSLIAFSID